MVCSRWGNRFKITFYCFDIPAVASRSNISVICLTRFRIRDRTCAKDLQVNAPNGQKAKCQLNGVLSMRIVVSRDWITLTHESNPNKHTNSGNGDSDNVACSLSLWVWIACCCVCFCCCFSVLWHNSLSISSARDINKWKCQIHQHLSGF